MVIAGRFGLRAFSEEKRTIPTWIFEHPKQKLPTNLLYCMYDIVGYSNKKQWS